MSEYTAVALRVDDRRAQAQMDALLEAEGIARDRNLTYSAGIFDENGAMLATGSLFENTLRCLAVDGAHRGEGLMADIVAHLVQVQLERGHTHLFLYTKCESAKFFAPLGFTEIARVGGRLVFMENRRDGFARYLRSLAPCAGDAPGAALVMNANPFTWGHAHLLRRAATENPRVVLFVLSEDRSLVPYADRLAMVRAAAAQYDNVQVVSSGSYMISAATFPSYFLKDDALVVRTHAQLDATLFTKIAAALNLTRRYVGEEPFSATTSAYNDALADVLPQAGIELVVVPRAEAGGTAISASHVRRLIHDGRMEDIRPLVPESTYAYLTGEPGQNAVRRIMAADDVIHH
ncbi:MAG: adenylyltransferase/cytidyltransferase family protein [Clostridia bacterium]|nr:adenylyltransferase/cytidyltransferase family protein [Clostridia bacterium]